MSPESILSHIAYRSFLDVAERSANEAARRRRLVEAPMRRAMRLRRIEVVTARLLTLATVAVFALAVAR